MFIRCTAQTAACVMVAASYSLFAWQNAPMTATAVGHEYRQDDLPAIAATPDGSLWAAWLSFQGERDDIATRRYRDGKWQNLQWVPGTSGDSWMPQIGVDSEN